MSPTISSKDSNLVGQDHLQAEFPALPPADAFCDPNTQATDPYDYQSRIQFNAQQVFPEEMGSRLAAIPTRHFQDDGCTSPFSQPSTFPADTIGSGNVFDAASLTAQGPSYGSGMDCGMTFYPDSTNSYSHAEEIAGPSTDNSQQSSVYYDQTMGHYSNGWAGF
ncbi:MAG: hypothetical protein Q9227_005427 [Pyrenula ochraceoflavens]